MTAKELKEILNGVDDDAVVVLYDGLDEGDVFCTTALQVLKENYTGYCQGDTCVESDCADKLFVLAGWGTVYEALDRCKNERIYMITSGWEGEASRIAAEEARKARMEQEKAAREQRMKDISEMRKHRFCINYSFCAGDIQEFNAETIEECDKFLTDLAIREPLSFNKCEYTIYDRVEKRVVRRRDEVKQ